MFTKRFTICRLLGIPIRLDLSWFVIVLLLAWSLAAGFTQTFEGLTQTAAWAMGILGALGLFGSVLLHELGHAVAARRYGVQMKGITLFIFGGVAEMTDEPPSPKAEFVVAIGGPLVSVALCVIFLALSLVMPTGVRPIDGETYVMQVNHAPTAATYAVVNYLATINLALLIFNMVPAFPLDGGRVLRAILWHIKDNLRWATRITATIGGGFGYVLIGVGVFALLAAGNWVAFIWLGLLGMFLRGAAQMSLQQTQLRSLLEGETVRDFMTDEPVTVSPDIDLRQFVDEYVYRHHFKMFPVMDDGRLVGCISTRQVKAVHVDDWPGTTVGQTADACGNVNTIRPNADATDALAQLSRNKLSRLMVVDDDGRLEGVIALKDMMDFLALKIDLEGEGSPGGALPNAQRLEAQPNAAA